MTALCFKKKLVSKYYLYISGSKLGLTSNGEATLSGEEIESFDLAYLKSIINNVTIFYRVTPRNKVKIVKVSKQ